MVGCVWRAHFWCGGTREVGIEAQYPWARTDSVACVGLHHSFRTVGQACGIDFGRLNSLLEPCLGRERAREPLQSSLTAHILMVGVARVASRK
jgi:hypothetical protein